MVGLCNSVPFRNVDPYSMYTLIFVITCMYSGNTATNFTKTDQVLLKTYTKLIFTLMFVFCLYFLIQLGYNYVVSTLMLPNIGKLC